MGVDFAPFFGQKKKKKNKFTQNPQISLCLNQKKKKVFFSKKKKKKEYPILISAI